MKIELFSDTIERNKTIVGYFNLDGTTPHFYGFHGLANEKQLNIKTYTSLEQIGLNDENMLPDDFAANLKLIDTNSALSGQHFIILLRLDLFPNFFASVIKKMTEDGFAIANISSIDMLKIQRNANGSHCNIDLEYYAEGSIARQKKIFARANLDGSTMNVYPFRELAPVEEYKGEIELLNGWEIYVVPFQMSKIGNYVHMDFVLLNGTRKSGTQLFVLPVGYRPTKSIKGIPFLSVDPNGSLTRLSIKTSGVVTIDGGDNTTGQVIFSGGFLI